jgi:hypothetical protein
MTTLEINLLSTELASARVNATLGASHIDQVRRTASVNASASGLNIRPLHLAIYHFQEAAKLIDQALGKEPLPAAPSMADYIAAAKAQTRALQNLLGEKVAAGRMRVSNPPPTALISNPFRPPPTTWVLLTPLRVKRKRRNRSRANQIPIL